VERKASDERDAVLMDIALLLVVIIPVGLGGVYMLVVAVSHMALTALLGCGGLAVVVIVLMAMRHHHIQTKPLIARHVSVWV
jgi:hypothetical protein